MQQFLMHRKLRRCERVETTQSGFGARERLSSKCDASQLGRCARLFKSHVSVFADKSEQILGVLLEARGCEVRKHRPRLQDQEVKRVRASNTRIIGASSPQHESAPQKCSSPCQIWSSSSYQEWKDSSASTLDDSKLNSSFCWTEGGSGGRGWTLINVFPPSAKTEMIKRTKNNDLRAIYWKSSCPTNYRHMCEIGLGDLSEDQLVFFQTQEL